MACTYDITTDRGKVRRLVNDISEVSCTFPDTEIDAFLSMASGSILLAASYAAEARAASLTDGLTSEKIGDYAYTKKEAENWLALAKKYREEDASIPYSTWAEMDLTCGSGITTEED